MTKTVLLTGARGFIGTYVMERLIRDGRHVIAFDHQKGGVYPEGVDVFLGDIRDASGVVEAMAHSDSWIHLAGVLGTAETIKNPRPAAETNIIGGLNILEGACQYGLPGVNIAVGNYFENNTYSLTKNTVERFCKMFAKDRGLPVTVVRGLNVYGPRQSVAAPFGSSKVRKVGPSFICRALTDMPIEIYGDGNNVMDFIYVTDMADTLVNALYWTEENGAAPTVIEAGAGDDTTVNDFANVIAADVINRFDIHPVINHLPMRPGETVGAVVKADPSTLEVIGMNVANYIPLTQGVPLTVDYYKDYLATYQGN